MIRSLPACLLAAVLAVPPAPASPVMPGQDPTEAAERDEIFSLLSYALTEQDWQSRATAKPRGHNVGAVLVSPTFEIVRVARNCTLREKDATQHAEVRVIQEQIRTSGQPYLRGFSLYGTLEPCGMCTGMMMFVGIRRAVHGQTDPQYGKTAERLFFDGRKLPDGLAPYPVGMTVEPSTLDLFYRLNAAYGTSAHRKRHDLVGWLQTDEAHELFAGAKKELAEHRVRHESNRAILKAALAFLEQSAGTPQGAPK